MLPTDAIRVQCHIKPSTSPDGIMHLVAVALNPVVRWSNSQKSGTLLVRLYSSR